MNIKILLVIGLIFAASLFAGVEEGKKAMEEGDFKKAYEEFLPLAEKGDDVAMITIGFLHFQGNGRDFKQDYSKAMDWFIKAFKKGNGDGYSNIGVMYRDGLSVKRNKNIAYCLFLITHMKSLGTESTQYRANNCLRKIAPLMAKSELIECYDYTEEYIRAYVVSKGTLVGIPDKYKPSKTQAKLKDKNWWLPGELDFLK
ncbi:MAG: sel1 repeat family protein [bacterium]|nr:sel1 repeat family protein [bacterium]